MTYALNRGSPRSPFVALRRPHLPLVAPQRVLALLQRRPAWSAQGMEHELSVHYEWVRVGPILGTGTGLT